MLKYNVINKKNAETHKQSIITYLIRDNKNKYAWFIWYLFTRYLWDLIIQKLLYIIKIVSLNLKLYVREIWIMKKFHMNYLHNKHIKV